MSDESESIEGLSKSGGSGKYAIVGLLLMLGTGGLWYFTKPRAEAEHATRTQTEAAPAAAAPTQQFDNTLDVPDEEPAAQAAAPAAHAPTAPRVARTDWDCSGEISVAEVRSAIGVNQNQVRQCYERRLRVDPMLSGNLQVRMKVSSSGTVSAVSVAGTMHDEEVLSCVRERVKQWHFPSPHGGQCAVIAAPFTLNPRQ